MIPKSLLVASLAVIPFAATVQAASPLLKLSDDGSANLFFVADASATYNDNIFYRKDKTADSIYTLAPGINLVVGNDSSSKFDLVFKEALTAYWDNSKLNNQRANLDAKYTYDAQSAFSATIAAGYHQLVQATNQTNVAGDIVKNETYNASIDTSYRVTEKSRITAGGNYNGTRYTSYTDLFNDQDSFSVPVSWLYAITDKLDLGFTYQYTNTEVYRSDLQTGAGFRTGNQQIHFAGLRATGAVSEKLKLEANAGVGYAELKSIFVGVPNEDNTSFNFNLNATYAITEKLTGTLSGGRNFSVGAQGQQITTTSGNLGLNYAISEKWSAGGSAGYMNQEFAGAGAGDDRIFTAGLNVNFTPDKYWKLTLGYNYFNDDTTRPGADDFDNNLVSFSASLRY